jgi:ribosomal protein S18 acetylase RimI-like enzyme
MSDPAIESAQRKGGEAGGSERVIEIESERSVLADRSLALIREIFPARERQPIEQIAMEIEEKRLGLLTTYDFHLFSAVDEADEVVAVASGVYLGGVNTGFITYLAVAPGQRSRGVGRRVRTALVEQFRQDARLLDWSELAAVVGEVRLDSPWLSRLVRDRFVIPLDLEYFHPGQDPSEPLVRWVLYRQPVADQRQVLPAGEIRQLLYAIWRRAYRVRWPLEREGFHMMLNELADRHEVGAHPEVTA